MYVQDTQCEVPDLLADMSSDEYLMCTQFTIRIPLPKEILLNILL